MFSFWLLVYQMNWTENMLAFARAFTRMYNRSMWGERREGFRALIRSSSKSFYTKALIDLRVIILWLGPAVDSSLLLSLTFLFFIVLWSALRSLWNTKHSNHSNHSNHFRKFHNDYPADFFYSFHRIGPSAHGGTIIFHYVYRRAAISQSLIQIKAGGSNEWQFRRIYFKISRCILNYQQSIKPHLRTNFWEENNNEKRSKATPQFLGSKFRQKESINMCSHCIKQQVQRTLTLCQCLLLLLCLLHSFQYWSNIRTCKRDTVFFANICFPLNYFCFSYGKQGMPPALILFYMHTETTSSFFCTFISIAFLKFVWFVSICPKYLYWVSAHALSSSTDTLSSCFLLNVRERTK